MIDLDDFKVFNDRNGHLAGDAVLRGMAAVLQSELRQSLDVAARYGGEEFAVILPNTPLSAVHDTQMEIDLAGRLVRGRRRAAAPPGHDGRRGAGGRAHPGARSRDARSLGTDGSMLPPLTVSIGVAVFPVRTTSPEDLVGHADAALYAAKRAGKDRVETYG